MADNQKIFDEILDDALKILRLAAGEKQASFESLDKLRKRLVAKLATENLNASQKLKMAKFFKAADTIIAEEYRQMELGLDLPEISSLAAQQTASSLEVAIGSGALNLPTTDYHNSVASNVLIQGAPSKEWWKRQAASTTFAFTNQVRQGLINGETNQQIISRIVGKNGQPGIMDIARRNAAALVQTSVQAVANDARRATFDANADVIKGIKQVSTLDGHTTLICISYSGKEWNLKREPIGHTMPFNGGCPRHFNCRSVEVPITKTFRELGLNIDEAPKSTRASSEGQIEANTSFDAFLKRRGKAYQDKMLGEGRADLWRDGKITLRDLVDGNGRPLTVAELRKIARPDFNGGAYMKRFDQPNVTPADIIAQFPADTAAKIKATQLAIDKLTTTDKLYSEAGKYKAARLTLHNKILYDGIDGFDPKTGGTKFYPGLLNKETVEKAIPKGSQPTFTILGGRGGSGKSAFDGNQKEMVDGELKTVGYDSDAKVYDKDNVVLFDSDVVKHMLPEFKGFNAAQVHEESSFILDRAIEEARKYKVNIVLDGTMKTYKSAHEKILEFKAAGYRLEAHYMHLPRHEAAKRAVERFLGPTGRYVPADIILANTDNEINWDKLLELLDDWSFRDNNVAKGIGPKLIAQKERKIDR